MKRCTECQVEKEENEENFYWKSERNKFETKCKICRGKKLKALRDSRPKVKAKKKEGEALEKYKVYRKKYNQENRESVTRKQREYYHKNRDRLLEVAKKWRQKNREKYNKSVRDSGRKFPLKKAARKILNYYVETGKILKPNECELCKVQKNIEAHHEDYGKPLEVIWLCKKCHGIKHRKKYDKLCPS